MTHAELLRNHADLATREGGMYYSGEYLSGIAATAESLEAMNAKLRELVKEMRVCLEDECKRCHEWGDACDLEHRMRELGVNA